MAKKLKLFFANLLTKWFEDFLILIGLGIIISTTYTISILIANYVLGFVFLLLGFAFAKK